MAHQSHLLVGPEQPDCRFGDTETRITSDLLDLLPMVLHPLESSLIGLPMSLLDGPCFRLRTHRLLLADHTPKAGLVSAWWEELPSLKREGRNELQSHSTTRLVPDDQESKLFY